MNRYAGALLLLAFACLVAGAWLIAPAAGLIVAGVLSAAGGVALLDVEPRSRR